MKKQRAKLKYVVEFISHRGAWTIREALNSDVTYRYVSKERVIAFIEAQKAKGNDVSFSEQEDFNELYNVNQ
jgi:hypothetical protein